MGCTASSAANAAVTPPTAPPSATTTKQKAEQNVQPSQPPKPEQKPKQESQQQQPQIQPPKPKEEQPKADNNKCEVCQVQATTATTVSDERASIPVKTEQMDRGSFSSPKVPETVEVNSVVSATKSVEQSTNKEIQMATPVKDVPAAAADTPKSNDETANTPVSLNFEVEIPSSPIQSKEEQESAVLLQTPKSTRPEASQTAIKQKPPGDIDMQTMLIDDRIQQLINCGKTDEDKLFNLFLIFDEDNDGFVSASEVDEIIWMTEASYVHSTPMKEGIAENDNMSPMTPVSALKIDVVSSSEAQPGQTNGEATYLDSPTAESASASQAPSIPQSSSSVATTPSLSPIGQGRATGPPKRSAAKKKLVHSPLVDSTTTTAPSSSANTLDDFSEASASQPATPLKATSKTPTPLSSAMKRAAERKPAEIDELNIPPEMVPPQKKGFLRVTSSIAATPSTKFRYHVLDMGTLFCLDSTTGSTSFSMDRTGISLKDRVLTAPEGDKNILTLTRPAHFVSVDEGDTAEVSIEIKGGDKKDWIASFKVHMEFADNLKNFSRRSPQTTTE